MLMPSLAELVTLLGGLSEDDWHHVVSTAQRHRELAREAQPLTVAERVASEKRWDARVPPREQAPQGPGLGRAARRRARQRSQFPQTRPPSL